MKKLNLAVVALIAGTSLSLSAQTNNTKESQLPVISEEVKLEQSIKLAATKKKAANKIISTEVRVKRNALAIKESVETSRRRR